MTIIRAHHAVSVIVIARDPQLGLWALLSISTVMKNSPRPRTARRVINPPRPPVAQLPPKRRQRLHPRLPLQSPTEYLPTEPPMPPTQCFQDSPPIGPRKTDQRARQATAHIQEIIGAGATGGPGVRHTGRFSKAFRGHTRPSSKGAYSRRTAATESGEGVFGVARSQQHCPSPLLPSSASPTFKG